MSTEVLAGGVGEQRGASSANGGTALTTTATFIQLPLGSYHIDITPRNFATAAVVKYALNPWLVVLKTTDAMATAPTDYSNNAQDNDASTDIDVSSFNTLANGDFLLVGSHLPFRGVYIDVDSTNSAGTATILVEYWNGSDWVDTSATDGTFSTRVWAQDGLTYWTVPTAWKAGMLKDIYAATPASQYTGLNYYWTRWSVSALLADSSVTFNSMVAASRITGTAPLLYTERISGQSWEGRIKHGLGGIGCVEALTDAGTANLIVNVATARDGRFA